MQALNYARKLHKGQARKSGEPYIIHPLTMACQAVSMGVNDDNIVAAILLTIVSLAVTFGAVILENKKRKKES